jgi:hypothetical protein
MMMGAIPSGTALLVLSAERGDHRAQFVTACTEHAGKAHHAEGGAHRYYGSVQGAWICRRVWEMGGCRELSKG